MGTSRVPIRLRNVLRHTYSTISNALRAAVELVSAFAVKRWMSIRSLLKGASTDRINAISTFLLVIWAGLQTYEMHSGGRDTHELAVAAKDQAAAAKALAEQAKAQLTNSISSFQTDQRAWVGIINSETIGGAEQDNRFGFESLNILMRNSGKTPAINISAKIIEIERPAFERIGDYDSLDNEFKQGRLDFDAKQTAEEIRKHPENAKSIIESDNEWRAREADIGRDWFPAGGVLAPEASQTRSVGGQSFLVREVSDGVAGRVNAVYVVGKITYNDVFDGTKEHTTKFCFMRLTENRFGICPTGNWMD